MVRDLDPAPARINVEVPGSYSITTPAGRVRHGIDTERSNAQVLCEEKCFTLSRLTHRERDTIR